MDALRTRMNAMDRREKEREERYGREKEREERYGRPACTRRTMAFIRVRARSCAFTSTLNSTSQLRRVGAAPTRCPAE